MSTSSRGRFETCTWVLWLVLFLPACSPASPAAASETVAGWEILGPGGGGAQYIPTINPADPKHVLVRCDMTGAYVTENGGGQWNMINLRQVVQDFAFDPHRPDTVYAASTGLFRSDDRGRSWMLVYPNPAELTGEVMTGDHASHAFRTAEKVLRLSISQVRVDPSDSNTLYAGLREGEDSANSVRLIRSKDRGATWAELARIPGRSVLGIFPGSWAGRPEELLVTSDTALARCNLRDGSVQMLESPAERLESVDGGQGDGGSRIYLLAGGEGSTRRSPERLFVSTDFGDSWKQLAVTPEPFGGAESIPGGSLETIATSEGHPLVVYLSARSLLARENGMPQRRAGILKTTDGGDTWQWVLCSSGGSILTRNFEGGWLYRQLGWLSNPTYLGVSPSNPEIVYGTDSGRTFKSEDGGGTWEQLISRDFPDGSSTTRGLDVTTTYGVHFDPFDPQHLFITYTDIGLFHSYDGGASWLHAIAGIPRQWRNTCYWLEFDPAVRGRIYSVWSNVHDLPRPKMYRSGNLVNGNQQGGAAVSGDGGRWWELMTRGVLQPDGLSSGGIRPGAVCTHIALDLDSPVNSRTLYVTDYGYGVWKSVDGGISWELKNRGIEPDNLYCWRITRLPSGRLLLLVARGGLEGGEVIPGSVYSSTDGAESWTRLVLPEGVTAPNDLVYDPKDPDRLYLSCWPLNVDGEERGGGLLRSDDGGVSWIRIFPEGMHVYAAAVSPFDSRSLFLSTFEGAAFRSDDRGTTWKRLEGYDFKWGHRPVPDPRDPARLYLTTFGGSVFRGPAEGVPDSRPTITNLPPSPWNYP